MTFAGKPNISMIDSITAFPERFRTTFKTDL